jgi:hypothetical protein
MGRRDPGDFWPDHYPHRSWHGSPRKGTWMRSLRMAIVIAVVAAALAVTGTALAQSQPDDNVGGGRETRGGGPNTNVLPNTTNQGPSTNAVVQSGNQVLPFTGGDVILAVGGALFVIALGAAIVRKTGSKGVEA